MRRVLVASLLLIACRQVAGIHPITFAGGDGGGGTCTNATAILTSSNSLDILAVAGGFAMAASESTSTGAFTNVLACPISAPCTQPPGLLSLAFNDTLESYAATSLIYYAVQTNATTGSIHSVSFDGKTDTVLLSNAAAPLWMGASGTRAFWTSDDGGANPASLHCIGCSGTGDQTWITGLGITYGVFTDPTNVYVIADDNSGNLTDGIYSCSLSTACAATPKQVITGLAFSALNAATEVASDGTNLYITNDTSAIIRVAPGGAQTNIVKGVAAAAIAVDPATSEVFYGADDGTVSSVKSDGSAPPVPLATCAPGDNNSIYGITFDATNVYVLLVPTSGSAGIYAIKR